MICSAVEDMPDSISVWDRLPRIKYTEKYWFPRSIIFLVRLWGYFIWTPFYVMKKHQYHRTAHYLHKPMNVKFFSSGFRLVLLAPFNSAKKWTEDKGDESDC